MTKEEIYKFMEQSISVMKNSVHERRKDMKPSPHVGAVLVRPDGSTITAYRGELREGDHAEFTLIERKCRAEKLDGCILFATLEPCAPGARHFPKLSCSERIVNARLAKVYIGIEDPDPTVCRKGVAYLLENGIEVEMYPQELQEEIISCNSDFLSAANERARLVNEKKEVLLSNTEKVETQADLEDLSMELLKDFLGKANLGVSIGDDSCNRVLAQLGLLSQESGTYKPTGVGLLLFGKNPQLTYPNARVKATYFHNDKEEIRDFSGPLLKMPDAVINWVSVKIDRWIDRSAAERKTVFKYPIVVINELVKNAIIHRDYDIDGAPIYIEINDDAIVIKSPGMPVSPLTLEQVISFSAPSLTRNPKLMYVFDVMGLAEQRGLGFKTVKTLPSKYKIPLPIVKFDRPYIVFTLPFTSHSEVFEGVKDFEIQVLDYLKLHPMSSRKEIDESLDSDSKKTERTLKSLLEMNKVVKFGAGKATKYSLKEK